MRNILLMLMVTFGFAHTGSARDFGMSPDAAILTFNMTGGQKPRIGEAPVLEILADGTITVRGARPGDPAVTGQLDAAEKAELFKLLIEDNHALEITQAAIETEISKSDIRVRRVPDAPITSLSITLPEGSNSVTVNGVSVLAGQVPDGTALNSLFRVQRLLLEIAEKLNGSAA